MKTPKLSLISVNTIKHQLQKATLFVVLTLFFTGCKKDPAVEERSSEGKGGKAKTSVADFTIAVIPDTQTYVDPYPGGGTPAMFTKQIDWILANRVSENIQYVSHLGDITDDGDNIPAQWTIAKNEMYRLEAPYTGNPHGLPYGMAVGNHDQCSPSGSFCNKPTAPLVEYNTWFGGNHFAGRAYYVGSRHGGNNNDSHIDQFTYGGQHYLIVYLEYDHGNLDWAGMNQWAYNMIGAYTSSKVIVVTHWMMDNGWNAPFPAQAQAIYDKLKVLPNIFMFLGGHVGGNGEGYREDTYQGGTIRTMLSDYQQRADGGAGKFRLIKISPDNNTFSVRTYSAHYGTWETDADSQFSRALFNHNYPVGLADGKYKITNRSVAKALVVQGPSTANNQPIVQYPYVADANLSDEWNIVRRGYGYYSITTPYSGKSLANWGPFHSEDNIIVQYPYAVGAQAMEWAILPSQQNGYYNIMNKYSGKYISVAGQSIADNAAIVLHSWYSQYSPAPSQDWALTAVP